MSLRHPVTLFHVWHDQFICVTWLVMCVVKYVLPQFKKNDAMGVVADMCVCVCLCVCVAGAMCYYQVLNTTFFSLSLYIYTHTRICMYILASHWKNGAMRVCRDFCVLVCVLVCVCGCVWVLQAQCAPIKYSKRHFCLSLSLYIYVHVYIHISSSQVGQIVQLLLLPTCVCACVCVCVCVCCRRNVLLSSTLQGGEDS